MDVVYFVKDSLNNDELRYSLRSICKNLKFDRVWIFGGCPRDIVPDVRIRVDQKGKTKWDRVRNMFLMACENKDLSDDFILFNDDFFIMQPTKEVKPLYRSSLEDHIKVLPKGSYSDLLKVVNSDLKSKGMTTLSYELHVPFIFNKKKLLELIKNTPELHCTRTLYGNTYNIGGEKTSDIKVFNDKPSFDYKSSAMLSTDDGVVNINNNVWRFIKRNFSSRCKYEL